MRAIRGIAQDRVERYGPRFLKLIDTARRTYHAIVEAQGGQDHRIIPISSGSVAEMPDSTDSDGSDEEANEAKSQYFEADTDMSNFNERSKL